MANNIVNILGDLGVKGSLIFQEDNSLFPENPSPGTMILKGSNLYAYIQVGDFTTWYPFNSKTRSYIHTQGQARTTWTVNHGLGTENVWYQAYNSAGAPIYVSRTIIDSNTFTLDLTEPTTGTVVVVAPDTVDVPTVKAQSVTVAADSANVTTIDSSGIRVNTSYVASQSYVDSAINGLATVAKTGSYADLTNKPSLFSGSYGDLTNKPVLSTVATSGQYVDIIGKPTLATVATSGSYNDLTDKPAGLSFSGSYTDLTNKPTLFSGAYGDLTGKPSLFSGSYTDLTNKPTLFSGAYADLTGKPSLATIATSGSYTDLTNKPTLFSGSYTDLTDKPITLTGYGITDAVNTSALGVTVATLDESGKVPSSQLPSYVDDVVEYSNLASFPGTGETGKIYVSKATNLTYRWSGSTYVQVGGSDVSSSSLKLETSRTISATGDASWSVSFDGTANVTASLTLSNSGVSAGTYKSVTVDAKGRVTAGTNPTTLEGYGITDALSSTNPTLTGIIKNSGSIRSDINALAGSNVDCSAGNYFTATISGDTSFTFSNAPNGMAYSFSLRVNHVSGNITFPSSVVWPNSSSPSILSGNKHMFIFVTENGGTTWRAAALVNYPS